MTTPTLTIAEEVVLLQLHDDDGTFINVTDWSHRYAMGGAILMELAEAGRIDSDLKKLYATRNEPIGQKIADEVLTEISNFSERRSIRYWVEFVSERADEIRSEAIDGLLHKGIIEQQDTHFLWVFRSRRYPVIDGRAEKEAKLRLYELLFSDNVPSPRDVILLCLVHATGILNALVPANQLETLTDRIEQVRSLDLIGQDVVSAIKDIELSIAIATAPLY